MPRDNRCMYMAHVCFYVCCSDCVGNVCCVAAVVKNSCFFSLVVLKYVVCLCRGCDGCCVFCLYSVAPQPSFPTIQTFELLYISVVFCMHLCKLGQRIWSFGSNQS